MKDADLVTFGPSQPFHLRSNFGQYAHTVLNFVEWNQPAATDGLRPLLAGICAIFENVRASILPFNKSDDYICMSTEDQLHYQQRNRAIFWTSENKPLQKQKESKAFPFHSSTGHCYKRLHISIKNLKLRY